MSQALASARKRRAPAPVNPLPTPTQQTNSISGSPNSGLTLPQVISLVDRRLINLETFMNETRNNGGLSQITNVNKSATVVSNASSTATETGKYDELTEDLTNIVEEVNSRFELLAGEILEMKNIVLKLQSFTMEVNKTLLEERNFIMSSKENIVLDDGSTDEKNLVIENEKTQPDEEKGVVSVLPVFEISNPNNFSASADL
jgi:hypothetical protein